MHQELRRYKIYYRQTMIGTVSCCTEWRPSSRNIWNVHVHHSAQCEQPLQFVARNCSLECNRLTAKNVARGKRVLCVFLERFAPLNTGFWNFKC